MKRIDTSTKSVDKFGAGKHGFTNGNPTGTPVPATQLDESWFDHVQEEIANLIENAGLTLDANDRTQLRQAVQGMITGAQKAVTISAATFEASVADGEVVRWDSGNGRFDEAIADGSANNRAVGIADVTNSKVYIYGECALFSGLTPGARYYLDASTAGTVTITAPADGVQVGIAKSATTLFVDIDAVGARTDQVNTFTKAQRGQPAALPATTGTVNLDFSQSNHFTGQATGNITFGNSFTNAVAGQSGMIRVQQDGATLRNWAFGTNWKHVGGSSAIPAQTQTLGAYDEIIYHIHSAAEVSFAVRSDVK